MKILWVCPLFLHPTTKGGQIRTLETLRQLHRRHEIHFAALADPKEPEGPRRASEYSTKSYAIPHQAPDRRDPRFYLQALGGFLQSAPVAVTRFRSAELRRVVARLQASESYDAVVCDFLAAAPNLPDFKNAVLFQHNVETTIWERHAETAKSWPQRVLFRHQARRMFAYERMVCRAVRSVIAVSEIDAQRMRERFGVEKVCDVPTGVDTEYFTPPDRIAPSSDLVFLGSMDWEPNVRGVLRFASEIWPRIAARKPDCRLDIVGRRPPPAIQALSQADPRIRVTGTVPDVRPYLWGSRISIVPLWVGGGTRLKIYEAMAAALPVVSTAIGAEGLPLTPGESILLGDDAESFATACLTLLDDPERAARMGRESRQLVAERFSWDAAARRFEQLLGAG